MKNKSITFLNPFQCKRIKFFLKNAYAWLCFSLPNRQVRVERLVCLLCSRPEFVAFCYHVPFRGKVPIQGGLGFFQALVFARERVENAFHCGAKAMQHRGSLNYILLFL